MKIKDVSLLPEGHVLCFMVIQARLNQKEEIGSWNCFRRKWQPCNPFSLYDLTDRLTILLPQFVCRIAKRDEDSSFLVVWKFEKRLAELGIEVTYPTGADSLLRCCTLSETLIRAPLILLFSFVMSCMPSTKSFWKRSLPIYPLSATSLLQDLQKHSWIHKSPYREDHLQYCLTLSSRQMILYCNRDRPADRHLHG